MKETSKTIHIRWIRSGIGFTRKQKQMVRSLGLRRLHQVIEAPDTRSVRGLVNKIPHLVEIVSPEPRPAWRSIPEYSIRQPEAASPAAVENGEAGREGREQGLDVPEASPEAASEGREEAFLPEEAARAGSPDAVEE
ncbi:MAG: 50S ribosomal protein L30 [Terriglobia bacterium]